MPEVRDTDCIETIYDETELAEYNGYLTGSAKLLAAAFGFVYTFSLLPSADTYSNCRHLTFF